MGIQDAIVLIVAAGAAYWVFRMISRSISGKSGCGCASASPSRSCGGQDRTGMKRVPVVTSEMVGRPTTESQQQTNSSRVD